MAKKEENIVINPELENGNVETNTNEGVNPEVKPVVNTLVNDKKNDELEAKKTAKALKAEMVRIKIPIDPLNPKDIMVPVVINGYQWLIKRGETVEVPTEVARILEEAKYI